MFYSKFLERSPTPCLGIETTPPAFIKKLQKSHTVVVKIIIHMLFYVFHFNQTVFMVLRSSIFKNFQKITRKNERNKV